MNELRLLTEAEVEQGYGIARGTLQDWRYKGVGPPWSKPEGRVYYRIADIEAWLDKGERGLREE